MDTGRCDGVMWLADEAVTPAKGSRGDVARPLDDAWAAPCATEWAAWAWWRLPPPPPPPAPISPAAPPVPGEEGSSLTPYWRVEGGAGLRLGKE